MKFWAKVKFKGEKNAEYLIRAFFKEFNPESSIVIRGKEAKVEIIFNNTPPMELIEAINHCDVMEFNFGKALGEYSEDETEQVVAEEEISEQTEQVVAEEETSEETEQVVVEEEISEQTEQVVAEEETSEQTEQVVVEEETSEQTEQVVVEEETSEQTEQVVAEEETSEQTEQAGVDEETSQQTEQPKKKRGRPATKKAEPTKVVNVETVNIPQLEEIVKKATSFEHFVKLVAEWLEMDKRQEFFVNLVIVGTEVEKMSWKELEKALKNKGVFYSQWDRIWTGQQVSEKLKDYSVTMLPLLNAIGQYKDYSFGHEQSDENSTEQATEEMVTVVEEESSGEVEETTPKNRVKMECMPEIPHFEETLGSVDKTQPIEERVRYVLTAMGLEKKNAQEQQEIFEIANTAVRVGRMAFDIIFLKANIPMESSIVARITFSKFINDFVCEYDSDKKVKLLDFLKQLQEIVMHESEIESFTDFTD